MAEGIELGKAFFSLDLQTDKFDQKVQDSTQHFEDSSKRISNSSVAISAAIGAAIGTVAVQALQRLQDQMGKLVGFFTTDALKVTAEYGLEMEHLGARMGMTASQAATLTGMMERQGIQSGVAARAMGILSAEVRQTQQSLDPFSTKMGQLLGTLRDTNGHMLNTSQVLDLARQKISGAATETERLQIAQQLFGNRMGGQLIPLLKLSNEEWDKQKASVEAALGPVDAAADAALKYKEAITEVEQRLRGMQLAIGAAVLPVLTQWIKNMEGGLALLKEWITAIPGVNTYLHIMGEELKFIGDALSGKTATSAILSVMEGLGLVAKGTTEEFKKMAQYQKEAADAATEAKKKLDQEAGAAGDVNTEINETARIEAQLVSTASKKLELAEKEFQLRGGNWAQVELAAQEKVLALTKQRATLEENMAKAATDDQREVVSEKLLQNQEQLDSIETELQNKRKAFGEEIIKLNLAGVDAELKYRQQQMAELLQRGDIIGAAGQMRQINQLRIQEGESALEFEKKIGVVSLQNEIEFQKQKLEIVKGNAQEERKVLESIADLDKQLYDQRTQFTLNYFNNTKSQYDQLAAAARSTGEVMTAADRDREARQMQRESTRLAGDVLHGGGTSAQWDASTKFAEATMKQADEMQKMGTHMTEEFRDAVNVSKDILKAAGVQEVREPGGPSPTVASLLSPAEGLATSGLARGSEIPRLDTSFSDMAIRIRDVFLGTIPNIQNFSDAIAKATFGITGIFGPTGTINTPGGGSSFSTPNLTGTQPPQSSGISTPAQPPSAAVGTVSFGGGPAVAVTPGGGTGGGQELSAAGRQITDAVNLSKTSTDELRDTIAALSGKLDEVITAVRAPAQVTVGVDPNTGTALEARVLNTVGAAISP